MQRAFIGIQQTALARKAVIHEQAAHRQGDGSFSL